MPLYVINLSLLTSQYVSDYSTKSVDKIVVKFDLTIDGDRGDDEGEWRVPVDAEPYFGRTSGAWRNHKSTTGERSILCQESEEPSTLSIVVWGTRSPDVIVYINDILKFPLFVGETGYGTLAPKQGKVYKVAWRVISRSF